MKNLSVSDMSRCLLFSANRALCEHVSVELGFKNRTDETSVRSQLLVDIAEIYEGRVVFCLPSTLPGVFSIEDVWLHDDGMLGSAVLMGCVKDPYIEFPHDEYKSSNNPNQIDADDPSSTSDINSEAPIDTASARRSNANGQHEYWVIIFDLESDSGFADIVYALITGRLRITIKSKDHGTGSYRLFTNELMPKVSRYTGPEQSGSTDLRSTA